MRRLRDESGFTLVEVLVVSLLGVVVLGAAYAVLDTSRTQVTEVQRRSESTQRARLAVETSTSILRAAMCSPSGTAPVDRATATSVDVWADLSGGAVRPAAGASGSRTAASETRPKPPDRIRLALENGQLVTYTWTGSWLTPDSSARSYSPALTATGTKRLVTDRLEQVPDVPFLRYYGYQAGDVAAGAQSQIALSSGEVPAADLPRIVRFAVAVRAVAEAGARNVSGVEFRDDVTSATVDPADSTPTLECAV